jgi:O-antigen ligase
VTAAAFGPDERARLADLLTPRRYRPPDPGLPVWVPVACVALVSLAALALVLAGEPWLAIAGMLSIPVLLGAFSRSDRVTQLVLFLLYTNAAVIANKFHGVPLPVVAAVPLLLAIPIARDVIFRGRKIIVTPVVPLMLAFLAVQLVGALFAAEPDKALPNLFEFALEGIALYLLVVNAIRTPEALRSSIWTLVLAGACMGALVFHQQVTGSYDRNYGGFAQVSNAAFEIGEDAAGGEILQPRLTGPLGVQNRFAQTLAMLLPLALALFWSSRSVTARIAALACFQLVGIGIALAFSRGAAVGIAFMFLCMLFMGYIRLRHLAIVGAMLVLVALAVPQYAVRLSSLARVGDALQFGSSTGFRNTDGATRSRLTEMLGAALAFADHPVVGVGPGMYREHYREYAERAGLKVKITDRESHSLYLGLAAEHGLLGVLVFTAIVGVTFWELTRARRRWRRRHPELANLTGGLLMALVGYLAIGFFLHFAYIRYFWLMMGLASAASRVAPAAAAARRAGARAPVGGLDPGDRDSVKRVLLGTYRPALPASASRPAPDGPR